MHMNAVMFNMKVMPRKAGGTYNQLTVVDEDTGQSFQLFANEMVQLEYRKGRECIIESEPSALIFGGVANPDLRILSIKDRPVAKPVTLASAEPMRMTGTK
ncbi:MAG: hypothetical protein ACRERU_02590 [Methylococcales bacterium]